MSNAWGTVRFGDVVTMMSGKTPSKDNDKYWGGTIPWISASSMGSLYVNSSRERLTDQGLQEGGMKLVKPFTPLVLVRGSILHQRIPVSLPTVPVTINQDVKALTVRPDVLDPDFFIAWLIASEKALLEKVEFTGIGAGKLDTEILNSFLIPLPPKAEQASIGSFASAINNRIEINRKMNETLESMARALFKSWFIDFDPVRAKMDGRWKKGQSLPGLPAELWDLFPATTTNTEIGEVPADWELGPISKVAELNPEVWSKTTRPDSIAYLDLASVKWGRIEEVQFYKSAEAPSRAQRVLRPGDTVVGTVRPGNGSFTFISEPGLTGSTGFAVLRPNANEWREFVYLAATDLVNIETLAHLADGAAYPAVRAEVVAATIAAIPSSSLIRKFHEVAEPWFAKLSTNAIESNYLGSLRDALLPKLISGEVRVSA